MNAKRTDPRVHVFLRPSGAYVNAAATTSDHLRARFDAERARLAELNAPRRRRRKPAPATPHPAQLQLVV